MEGTGPCANRPEGHDRAIDPIMDAPGISPQHLIGVMDAGLASLPGRQTSGYDRTAQAIITAGKRPDVDGHPDLPQ